MPRNRRQLLRSALSATAALCCPGFLRAAARDESKTELVTYHDPKSYDVEHTVTIANRSTRLSSIETWLPVPISYHEQTVENLKVAPRAPILSDVFGQAKVARLLMTRNLPFAGQSFSLKLTYRINASCTTTDVGALDKLPYQPYKNDRVYKVFTRPETKIETKLPEIQKEAKRIRGDRRPAASIARDAYEWVLGRTTYQLIDGFGGAKYCLTNKHGECGDYSSLFVALCRAAGVPARIVTGFWAAKTSKWHVWAEFRIPTGEWIPVDASIGDQNDGNRKKFFGHLDNKRVALCRTADVQLRGVTTGHASMPFLQVGACWWQGKSIGAKPKIDYVAKGKAI